MKKIIIVLTVITSIISGWALNDFVRYIQRDDTLFVVDEDTLFKQYGSEWLGEPGIYQFGERVKLKEVNGDRIAYFVYKGETSYWLMKNNLKSQ